MGRKGARSAADTASALALAFVLNLNSVTTVWPSFDDRTTLVCYSGIYNVLGGRNSDGMHPLKLRCYSVHVKESPAEVARLFEEATA